MKFDKAQQVKNAMLLYAVTDRAWTGDNTLYQQVEQCLKGGATLVQIREKGLSHEAFVEEAKDIVQLCHSYGVLCLIFLFLIGLIIMIAGKKPLEALEAEGND